MRVLPEPGEVFLLHRLDEIDGVEISALSEARRDRLRATKIGCVYQGFNLLQGRISFAAYLGNTIRYDIDVGHEALFKVDIRDSWHHQLRAVGSPVAVSFDPASCVAVHPQ